MIDLSTIVLLVIGLVVLALLFRALAGVLTIVLALGIVGFVGLLIVDAYQGGTAYRQAFDHLQTVLTGLAVAIAGVVTTFLRSRSAR